MDLTKPYLEIIPPEDGEPRIVPLTKTRITIGRDPSHNDIALQPDPQRLVSRQEHCFVELQGSCWSVGSNGSSRNPTLLRQGSGLCLVQNLVVLTDGMTIYIQGRLTETGEPLFWKCRFRDPEGTQSGHAVPYLAYEWSRHHLFRVVGGVSEVVHLSPREDRLLQCLWAHNEEHHAPSVVSVSDLMQAVWGEEASTHSSQELHKLVSSIREKMEIDPETPRFLQNDRGKGYVLTAFPLPEITDA